VNGGVCIKHGAKVKRCSVEDCDNKALKGGVCLKHGAKIKRCSVEDCNNFVQRGGVCKRHGAKKTPTSKKAKGTGRKRKSQDGDNESDDYDEDFVNVTEVVEIAARGQRKTPTRAAAKRAKRN